MITHICLEAGVPKLPEINQFIELKNTTDLGLIWDTANTRTRKAKQGVTLLAQGLQSKEQSTKVTGVDDLPVEVGQFEPQQADAVGPSRTLISLPTTAPYPSSCRSTPTGYVILSQVSLNEIMKRLGIVEEKVRLMEEGL